VALNDVPAQLPLAAGVIGGTQIGWDVPRLGGFNVAGGVKVTPEFVALLGALVTYTAGFIAEVVRGTVGSIEKGQSEAALSIGMTRHSTLLWVLLPQAWRPMLPALTNDLITLTKNSSLLSVISVYELTRAGQAIIATHFAPFEIFLLLALYYWALISALAWASRRIERALPSW
jgi:ABC-type amino acid transport system permease subunit